MSYTQLLSILKGGPTSGNWGHAGRPGKRGGSAPRTGIGAAMSLRTGRDWQTRQEAKRAAAQFQIPINQDTKREVLDDIYNAHSSKDIAEALDYVKQVIKGADLSIRIPDDVLGLILADGRFKNQHESGRSEGYLGSGLRMTAERNAFGKDLEDPQDFPIYGYMATKANGYDPNAYSYGSVRAILNDDVKARTTITLGDSLWAFEYKTQVGTPLLKPGVEGLDNHINELLDFKRGINTYNPGYIEAQIHGGLSVKDIKHVYIHEYDSNAIIAAVQAGVPYTIYSRHEDPELMK